MQTNEFEKVKVFSFNDSIEYSDGGIVSKTVLNKETGNISLFSFANGEVLSEHTAPSTEHPVSSHFYQDRLDGIRYILFLVHTPFKELEYFVVLQ